MDTNTRTWTRRIAFALALLAATGISVSRASVPEAPAVLIHAADAEDERAIDWALRRYREAGLDGMPSLEVFVHGSNEACHGGLGLYHAGRIDLCTRDASEPYARKFALHELAHAWTEANIDPETLERFMHRRGIAAWNDRSEPWKERGTEQAAEVVTWGLGEGRIRPLLPEETGDHELARLFELLTGRRPITPAAVA